MRRAIKSHARHAVARIRAMTSNQYEIKHGLAKESSRRGYVSPIEKRNEMEGGYVLIASQCQLRVARTLLFIRQ